MKVAVFGLGYVGSVSAACLAAEGHLVLGVDPDARKTDAIREGRPPQSEPGLAETIRAAVDAGALRIAESAVAAVRETDLALVCVGTPSGPDGGQDRRALERVSEEIGAALADRTTPYGFVVRSTCLPGTLVALAARLAAASGRPEGEAFDLASNPEFLREGTALADFREPPFTLVGTTSEGLANRLRELYAGVEADFLVVAPEVAESVKLVSNAFHAAKITFANEVGRILKPRGVDGRAVMEILCRDRILNISPAYLRPGFSYGGSCLPKDVRALVHLARHADVSAPLMEALPRSNHVPVEATVRLLDDRRGEPLAVVGLSFKSDTDDMRESPYVELVERLAGRGHDLRIYDPDVHWEDVHGSNRRFVETEAPHIARRIVPTPADLAGCRTWLLGKRVPEILETLPGLPPEALVLDLAGVLADASGLRCRYEGVGW